MTNADLPAEWFLRQDQRPDAEFYTEPRFVAHIDAATIDALTNFYREFLPAGADLLDLMSSWISHLPTDQAYGRVAGLGMNAAELAANPQLTEHVVHDLNETPELPFEPASFDRATIAVSIQYLIRPIEVLTSVARTLRPGGQVAIAMSHRLFPTKAIMAFQQSSRDQRAQLVAHFLTQAGFSDVQFIDRSPANADPLWLVVAGVA